MKNIIIFLLLCLTTGCFTVEEAEYKVITKDGSFELREYSPHILAETEVEGSLEDAGDKAFRPLFNYISGENQSKKEIAMTAPVSQEAASEKIVMTAPVGQQRGDKGWKISFMMPKDYTMETLPKPNNPKVKLRQVPSQQMASVEYSGFWSEENYSENLAKLNSWTDSKGFKKVGDPIWARYNPPFTLWFLRRNEILIPVESSKKTK